MYPHTDVFPRIHAPIRQQRGVVLVTGLVFLMVMTLIGITAMQSSGQEERMASNLRQQNLAFQAAEAALRAAELSLQSIPPPTISNGVIGQHKRTGTSFKYVKTDGTTPTDIADYWLNQYDWEATTAGDNAGSTLYNGTLDSNLSAQPRYVIELMSSTTGSPSSKGVVNKNGASGASSGAVNNRYRVTARGAGGTSDSIVIVQSYFEP